MKTFVKAALLAGAAWSVIPSLAVAQSAAADAEQGVVEELVVTARRREETLKDALEQQIREVLLALEMGVQGHRGRAHLRGDAPDAHPVEAFSVGERQRGIEHLFPC